MDFMLLLLM